MPKRWSLSRILESLKALFLQPAESLYWAAEYPYWISLLLMTVQSLLLALWFSLFSQRTALGHFFQYSCQVLLPLAGQPRNLSLWLPLLIFSTHLLKICYQYLLLRMARVEQDLPRLLRLNFPSLLYTTVFWTLSLFFQYGSGLLPLLLAGVGFLMGFSLEVEAYARRLRLSTSYALLLAMLLALLVVFSLATLFDLFFPQMSTFTMERLWGI